MGEGRTCIGPLCREPAARGDLCWGHLKQRERGQALRPIEKLTPEERVIEAGSDMLEAEGDREYRTARARFLKACAAMFVAEGWRPPPGARVVVVEQEDPAQLGLGFEARARRRAGR